jgi:hypothetical protein
LAIEPLEKRTLFSVGSTAWNPGARTNQWDQAQNWIDTATSHPPTQSPQSFDKVVFTGTLGAPTSIDSVSGTIKSLSMTTDPVYSAISTSSQRFPQYVTLNESGDFAISNTDLHGVALAVGHRLLTINSSSHTTTINGEIDVGEKGAAPDPTAANQVGPIRVRL